MERKKGSAKGSQKSFHEDQRGQGRYGKKTKSC